MNRAALSHVLLAALLFALPTLILPLGAPVFAQDVDECSEPDLDFAEFVPATDEIDVDDVFLIGEIQVFTDITHGDIGELTIEISNFLGTTVVLFEESGGDADDILVTWSDAGVPHGDEPFSCDCVMAPGEALSAFESDPSDGPWELEIVDFTVDSDGTLNEWCLQLTEQCPVPVPADLSCFFDGDGNISLEWTNEDEYDAITVFRDGEELEELDGEDTSFLDEDPDEGVYDYELVFTIDDDDCPALCQGEIPEQFCNTTDFTLADSSPPVLALLSVSTSIDVGNIEIDIDIEHDNVGDLTFEITSADSTTVELHDNDGDEEVDLFVIYSESGVANGSEPYDCNCRMQPSAGPGALEDLFSEDADGIWILTAADTTDADDGTLLQWCVYLYETPPTIPPVIEEPARFIRGDMDGNGAVGSLVDPLFLLEFAFLGGDDPPCDEATDADGSGTVVALVDALYLLQFFFQDGDEPPAPYPDCGALDPPVVGCLEDTCM